MQRNLKKGRKKVNLKLNKIKTTNIQINQKKI